MVDLSTIAKLFSCKQCAMNVRINKPAKLFEETWLKMQFSLLFVNTVRLTVQLWNLIFNSTSVGVELSFSLLNLSNLRSPAVTELQL